METLAVQPLQTEIIDRYERAYNDATTWFAETLDGTMRSTFEFQFDGHDFIASDGGRLKDIFEDALIEAKRIAFRDPKLAFELRRRAIEAEEHDAMLDMARGEAPNTMIVVSDFPEELMDAYGDVGGYNVTRKQTMLRVLSWDGSRLTMSTQSLDGSDRAALESIYDSFGLQPEPGELLGQRITADITSDEQPYVIDRLTGTYDRSLEERFGGNWYAGRRGSHRDTLDFVVNQQMIVDQFVEKQLAGGVSERDFYNTAALLTEIFEGTSTAESHSFSGRVAMRASYEMLESQLELAGGRAAITGKTFSGCGASAGPNTMSASEQLDQAGYGNLSNLEDEDKYGPLIFKCKNGHTNRRPKGQLIRQCRVSSCKNSVAC